MPAVQLVRLRAEIDALITLSEDPERFSAGLHALLDRYADRTYRPTHNISMLVPQYNVPALALRQLELAMGNLTLLQPDTALRLADRLWDDQFLEPRSLAASLIGWLPPAYNAQVVERLRRWCTPAEDRLIINAMLARGSAGLRDQSPEEWFRLVKTWLEHEESDYRLLGMRGLMLLVDDERYENLPAVFSQIASLLRSPLGALQGELTNLLQALARRSPSETAYFLRQMVTSSSDPSISRIARRCLPLLPPSAQTMLRSLLTDRQR